MGAPKTACMRRSPNAERWRDGALWGRPHPQHPSLPPPPTPPATQGLAQMAEGMFGQPAAGILGLKGDGAMSLDLSGLLGSLAGGLPTLDVDLTAMLAQAAQSE